MDPVTEIKARLPIEDLVGQYCQLQKKGRQFLCLCPFHNDTKPSMQVSPDKGIAYCFACNSGGDVFSFYQQIEGVDFRQAVKDLGEKAGVDVGAMTSSPVKKDEKERLRHCLEATEAFYTENLLSDESASAYVQSRGISQEIVKKFRLGVAPNSFSATYDHLLKAGHSRNDIVQAGIAIQKEIEGKTYDRFRHRLMFPIDDHQGRVIGFGGRTLGDDDAKYINSAESPLYHKSRVLYGLFAAKEAMRSIRCVILVEGYFDVLACHQVGVEHVVAVCGTAFTDEHAVLLRRHVDTVLLCLDQDRAGRDAAEKAFLVCTKHDLAVHSITLNEKDPADMAQQNPKELAEILEKRGVPYLDAVLQNLQNADLRSAQGKREALGVLLPLLAALPGAVERDHYLAKTAALLGTTQAALQEDIQREKKTNHQRKPELKTEAPVPDSAPFSRCELSLGLLILYPQHRSLLSELIEPMNNFAATLYQALKELPDTASVHDPDVLNLSQSDRERLGILLLYCEQYGFHEWSDVMAIREIRRNCSSANRDTLRLKLKEITTKLVAASQDGNTAEQQSLQNQYQQIIKLSSMIRS